jgi:hypothetical protein
MFDIHIASVRQSFEWQETFSMDAVKDGDLAVPRESRPKCSLACGNVRDSGRCEDTLKRHAKSLPVGHPSP